ncbi:uncharacterized protein LOC135137260 [Zophobas morio]|uniref:uncharacterized protein LOC135137260 n=1 Tax=Zophobas morio TaxID=2755281 RepID=UPI003083319A
MANTFYKRPGTTDKGKDYEDFSVANLVLRLVTNKQIQNFQISSNDENFGAFDDVVLEYQTDNNSEEKYALQLKHVRGKTLTLKALTEDSGNYSIKKYFKSYQQFKKNAGGYKLAILTNAKFEAQGGTPLEFFDENEKILVKAVKCEANPFINMSQKSDQCYKFQIEKDCNFAKLAQYDEFFQAFFLYPNQENVDQVKINVLTRFEDNFCSNISIGEKYLQFVAEWSIREGMKEKLDRDMMRKVIGMQVLLPYIQPLVFTSVNENIKLLQKVIDTFNVTCFDEDCLDCVRQIWGDASSDLKDMTQINSLCQQYQLSLKCIESIEELSDTEASQLLWLMRKAPLIITRNSSTLQVLDLCHDLKFVLLGSQPSELSKISIFHRLSNITDSLLLEEITINFKCSFQGKQPVTLQAMMEQNEGIKHIVTTNELLQMANDSCRIGGGQDLIPSPYISRSLLKNLIEVKFLDSVDNDTTVIISNFSKNNFNGKRYEVIFFDKDKDESGENLDLLDDVGLVKGKLYVTENELSVSSAKNFSSSEKFHFFRMNDDGHLEWISSRGGVSDLDQYAMIDYFMEEAELLESLNNNIDIINGDPGMGKSLLMSNLKNNFSPSIWTIIFSSKDISFLCSHLRNRSGNFEAFIDFIMNEKYGHGKIFDKKLLKLLIKSGHVVYFWDALDEISDKELKQVTNLIQKLSKKCYKQFVTCRPHLKKALEKKFTVLSKTLTQFDVSQQLAYMEKRFCSFFSEDNLKNLIAEIQKKIVETDHFAILSVPIQMFMLTELFLKNPDKYVSLLEGVLSITDLYHHFIEESFAFYFRDKANVSSPNHILQQSLDLDKKYRIANYEKLSLELLFGKEFLLPENTNIDEFLQEIEQEGDSCGFILEVTKYGKVVFVHNSYAEYFVASFLSKHSEVWRQLSDIIFITKFTNIRLFFDLILARDCLAHVAVLQKNLEALKRYENLIDRRDLGGRTALHLACSWGVRYPLLKISKQSNYYLIDDESAEDFTIEVESSIYIKILEFLLDKCNIYEEDRLFNLNSKSYAEKLNCLVTLMTMNLKYHFRISDSDLIVCNILYYSVLLGDAAALNLFDDAKYVVAKLGGRSLLHFAVVKNNIKCVEKLLSFPTYRIHLDSLDHFASTTPLILACLYGYNDIVELLLKFKADANMSNKINLTPLHLAAAYGHHNIVVTLIKYGAKANAQDEKKATPLHFACDGSYENIVNFLLLSGADSNVKTKKGVTPLCLCANKGSTGAALSLILSGADVNLPLNDGRTPLHLAAYNGHEHIVESLIAYGADTNPVESQNGYTPLHVASAHGHLQVVTLLLKANANPNFVDRDGITPVYLSSQNGHVDVTKTLLTFKADINIYNQFGVTPLAIACHREQAQIVDFLSKHGADVDFRTNDGWTPLYVACSRRNLKMVQSLLIAKANPNISDREGSRPLHAACSNGAIEIVELLLMYKANVNAVDASGVQPLHLAVDKGSKELAELLIRMGADIEASIRRGWKSLHIACSHGFIQIVGVLIEAGVKIDNVAVEVAQSKGYSEIVELLMKTRTQRRRQSGRCSLC